MRTFSKVGPQLWHSARFRSQGDEARLLFLYLLTSPHQTACGVCTLPDAYAAADLAWDVARYQNVRASLARANLITVDETTSEILIERWFQHCAPANGSHLRGIEKVIAAIQSPMLRMIAEKALAQTPQAKLQELSGGGTGRARPISLTEHRNQPTKG